MAISSSSKHSSSRVKSDSHYIATYNAIMACPAARGLLIDLQILDSKASVAYKEAITLKWNAKFQLVPLDMHRQNQDQRVICTFKDHFLAILASVDSAFPPYLWDLQLNSPSIFSDKPCSIQGLAGKNFSRGPFRL
jgi:hypothetical protein